FWFWFLVPSSSSWFKIDGRGAPRTRTLNRGTWNSGTSKIYLRAHLEEARLQHRGRRQPRRRSRRERLVITQHRRAVEDIVDVDTEVGPPTAETDVLRDSQVELVDAVAVQRSRLNQVDGR